MVILELIHASKPDLAEGLCLVAQNLLSICMPSCKFDRGNLCVVRHVGNCRFVTADSLLDLYSPPRNEKTRGSGTAAGFVPKPWQTLAIKTAERYLRNPLNTKLDLLSSWHIGQLFSSWLRRTAAKHPPTDSRKHLETRRLAEADQQQDSGPNQAKH